MILPADFIFSQSNLQDYRDCPYRFYLRYIRHVRWPALVVEDALDFEQRGQSGARFHRLVQQYLLGIPEARLHTLVAADPDPALSQWWNNFLTAVPPLLEGEQYVETTLTTTLAGSRLMAKYDLILVKPDGRLVIFDWKTSAKRPRKDWLEDRIQTRLYRFLLARSGTTLTGSDAVAPEQIEMNYWFAAQPTAPIPLPYDAATCERDRQYFTELVEEIQNRTAETFFRTSDEAKCRFCVYRAHCDRGTHAGDLAALDPFGMEADTAETELDFDQIQEIEF